MKRIFVLTKQIGEKFEVVKSIKKYSDVSTTEALALYNKIELNVEMDETNFLYSILPFYDHEYRCEYPEHKDFEIELYSKEEIKAANEWRENLSPEEQRYIDILISENSIGPACG